jgi:hypothetical protein
MPTRTAENNTDNCWAAQSDWALCCECVVDITPDVDIEVVNERKHDHLRHGGAMTFRLLV